MSTLTERLKEGVPAEEVAAVLQALPPGCEVRINRNMLMVAHDGNLKSLDQVAEGIPEQTFDIWMEGHNATGSRADATHLGRSKGRTFREAVLAYFRKNPDPNFNPKTLAVWGCSLYPSEDKARESFG